MKNLFMFFAVVCLVSVFVSSAIARDPVVDVLVNKGIVSEDEIAAAEAAAGGTWGSSSPDVTMGGYGQARYTIYDDDSGMDDTFSLSRLYWMMRGTVAEDWSVHVGAYLSHDFVLLDATLTWEIDPMFNLSAGQFLLPFSFEQLTSSSKLDTVDRAVISDSCCDHRDIGVRANGSLMENKVTYGVAIVNGNGINTTDNNDKKDVVARVQVQPFLGTEGPLAGLLVAGAFQTGEQPMMGVDALGAEIVLGDEKRTRYIGTAVWKFEDIKLQGEYLQQELEDSGITADGYYVLGTYDLEVAGQTVQPVVKYEQMDPNDDVDDDETKRTTLGVNWFAGPKTKISVNYRIIDEEPVDVDNNELIAQWQQAF